MKNNAIKKMIDDAGTTRYRLSKETGITLRTLDGWYLGRNNPNTKILSVIIACSRDDADILKNIKRIME